ncbi:MAG: toll/interleukin-1 receptor domain-containing protein [Terracidiphilus sp.]|nr:toll/interleukin-1 receptor domain-containing protein [Terracidiphilus sp.]
MATRKKLTAASPTQTRPEQKRSTTESPLVFISHDSRDADLAEAFGNLLTDASGGILKSFRSSDRKGTAGIEYGQEWYRAIMQKLDDATDVVALLTARSVNRPWILYEAGVAKGKLASNDRVFGIALGITLDEAATGPFAQFQNSPDEEDSLTTLVLQLIRRHPQAAPREEAVRLQVKAFRESIASLLNGRKKETTPHPVRADETSVAKFFEEIKVLVGGVPERVAGQLGVDPQMRRMRRRRRIHPGMLESILHHPMWREETGAGGVPILVMFSLFRDDFPWLYEIAAQLYRAIEEGDPRRIERARRTLLNTIEITTHGPLMHEMMNGPDDEEALMFLHHFIHKVDRFVIVPKRARKIEPPPQEKER